MKISPSVYFYSGGKFSGSTYVIRGRKKQIIIDLGRGRSIKNLWRALKKDGLSLLETDEIWITHAHPDHSKVAFLAKKLGCRVRCHPKSVAILNTDSPWHALVAKQKKIADCWANELQRWPDIIIMSVGRMFYGGWRQVKNLKTFHDREIVDLGDIKVKILFLAGHSEDSASFWVIRERVFITGDLIRTNRKYGFPCFNTSQADFSQAMKSLSFLYWTRIKVLAPGHGTVMEGWRQIRGLIRTNIKTSQLFKKKVAQFFSENQDDFTSHKLIHKLVARFDYFWANDMLTRDRLFFTWATLQELERKNLI